MHRVRVGGRLWLVVVAAALVVAPAFTSSSFSSAFATNVTWVCIALTVRFARNRIRCGVGLTATTTTTALATTTKQQQQPQ
jgi:hypothetical protein